MAVDHCAARNSTRRNMDCAGLGEGLGLGEGAMEIVPLEMYDSARAKIDANLRWLFAKAYGIDHIPEDLRDPFYTDQYDQEHIKPPVIQMLLSGELYRRVCALILKTGQAAALQSHLSVIQALARKGIYVAEGDGSPVAEDDLADLPIKMSAHIPMIDALMMAYTVEMISIEKVVACVKRFSTFSASKELPFDLEDAMVFWINKVNMKMREITERELKAKQHPLDSPSHHKVRYRREQGSGRQPPYFPLLEDLMRDVCDGAALLTLVHYYCPDLMKLEDVCLKEVTSIADSLYNIQLLKEFANEYLNKSFYLSLEDMLYAPLVLKHNVMVFIAELFWWFETVKPDFVQPRDVQELKDVRAVAQPKSARPSVPISNATKRSFLVTPGICEASLSAQSSPEPCNRYFLHPEDPEHLPRGGSSFSPSHPLLPLRQRQQKQHGEDSGLRLRSNSLTQAEGQSRGAGSDRRPSDADVASGDSVSLARSISKDSLASNIVHVTPKHQAPQLPQAAPRRVNGHSLLANVSMEDQEEVAGEPGTAPPAGQPSAPMSGAAESKPSPSEGKTDGFYLEPLMPAVLKPPKEKSVCLNKEEESGEARSRGRGSLRRGEAPVAAARRKAPTSLNQTYTPTTSMDSSLAEEPSPPAPGPPEAPGGADPSSREPAEGFYLRSDQEESVQDLELEDVDEEDLDEALTIKHPPLSRKAFEVDEESAKLREDMNVKEHQDKDGDGGSGRSSPCLSSHSQASSLASGSVRMTSFAERKAHQQRFGSNHDLRSSASSSQRTTPDGSECSGPLSLGSSWRLKRDQSPSSPQGARLGSGDAAAGGGGGVNMLASELVQLHMQLEEKRRAIEHQKKKMELLSARQRQKLGKAAFLHIVKKGKSDTLPGPLKTAGPQSREEPGADGGSGSLDDVRKGALRRAPSPGRLESGEEELDLNECNRSIDMLNEAIGSIQQQMMQLSLQQELLMKQNIQPPPAVSTNDKTGDPKVHSAVHFVDSGVAPLRKPPKLSSARGARSKPSELKLAKEQGRQASRTPTPTQSLEAGPNPRLHPGGRSPRTEHPDSPRAGETIGAAEKDGGHLQSSTFRLHDEANMRLPARVDLATVASPEVSFDECLSSTLRESELNSSDGSGKENMPEEETAARSKAHLIEVDLSDLRDPEEEGGQVGQDSTTDGGDGEQKSGLGFFFKDEQKAEDELAKKRAAFLLKQQKKAEEARLRKQQLEVETEVKRDEVRRKAEEDRLRKEEEKTRRELIKQDYLRRKQKEMFEEQGVAKPAKPTKPTKKQRPKPVFREESSSDTLSKCSSTTPENLSSAQSGSSLSLASGATNEADSVNSGGASSQRGESVESFPGLSRNASRSTERDWDNGSTASSIASMAEYTGPKLFKEPSAKSNKPIIHNAISHCCLAGKVNEPQKIAILEELEKCESNHLMILFRDGGCQFRALYSYFPDSEEIHKLTGNGPKSIGKKMIDKLYKYSSDRKQFTAIPAKTVSVSVDAITIHNHLWQVKRSTVPKKGGK